MNDRFGVLVMVEMCDSEAAGSAREGRATRSDGGRKKKHRYGAHTSECDGCGSGRGSGVWGVGAGADTTAGLNDMIP